MADNLTPRQRSLNMSRIRSRGNASTELRLIALFKAAKISGWRRGSAMMGRPDFVFPKKRVAVFVDGCFWHGCPKCSVRIQTNPSYWSEKLNGNKRRDRLVATQLRRKGWHVIRIWEHALKEPAII